MTECSFCDDTRGGKVVTARQDRPEIAICNECIRVITMQTTSFLNAELEYLSWFSTSAAKEEKA